VATGKSFHGQTINIGSESFEHCRFDGCVLVCNSPEAYLRFRNNRLVATLLLGDGWPDTFKDEMNGPALEQFGGRRQ
jgi:hypothetical protein